MICFVKGAEMWFGGTMRREQRGGYIDANEEAKKKMLKLPQTENKNIADSSKSVIRVTKIK